MTKKLDPRRAKTTDITRQGCAPNIRKVRRIVKRNMGVYEFCKAYGITKSVYYRWKKNFPLFLEISKDIRAPKKGPKVWEPPLERITQLASMGLNKGQVAAQLGVKYDTYMSHQRQNPKIPEAFERGQEMGVATIKGVLYSMATKQNLSAVLAFLKRHDHETEEMPTKIVTEVIYSEQDSTGRIKDES